MPFFKSHCSNRALLAAACLIALVPAHTRAQAPASSETEQETDFKNPEQVRQLVERIREQPQPQAIARYYAPGVAHLDSFVPCNSDMAENCDRSRPHYIYTYHDGLLAKCEFVDVPRGNDDPFDAVWYNAQGAPILVCRLKADDSILSLYAVYDAAGKVQQIYRFNGAFKLLNFQQFTYTGDTTRITTLNSKSQPQLETRYDDGEVFLIQNGKQRKVNRLTRKETVCRLEKFGLKPIYPKY